jgi:hypothetical protein
LHGPELPVGGGSGGAPPCYRLTELATQGDESWPEKPPNEAFTGGEETRTDVNLIVGGAGSPRTIHFSTLERLVQFQADMETLLLRTGWSFSEFSPEQRSGRERRGFPRMAERRRWWTDSVRLFRHRDERSGY